MSQKIVKIHYTPNSLKLRFNVDKDKVKTIAELKPIIVDRLAQKVKDFKADASQISVFDDDSFELDDTETTENIAETTVLRVSNSQIPTSTGIQAMPQSNPPAHVGMPTVIQQPQVNTTMSTSASSSTVSGAPPALGVAKVESSYKPPDEGKVKFSIRYRIINGPEPQKVHQIGMTASREDSTLYDLKTQIFKKHGVDNQKHSAGFYDECGMPLTRTFSTMTITDCSLVGGFGEEVKMAEPLPRLVYLVIVNKKVDSVCYPKLAHDLQECTTQIFIMHNNKSNVLRIDLEKDTVKMLKQKVYSKTDVPTDRQSLNYGGKLLTADDNLVNMYGVGNNSNVVLNIVPARNEGGYGYSSNFSGTTIETLIAQTPQGVRQFRSALYVLVGRIGNDQKRFLALLREMTNNNAPLVSAMYRLIKRNTLLYTERLAIEEGFLALFTRMLTTSQQIRENVLEKHSNRVFEFSRACFAALIKACKEPTKIPERWSDVENYTLHDFNCAVSAKQIQEVVGLKLDNGKVEWCDKLALIEKQAKNEKVNGIEKVPVPDSALTEPPNANFYLKAYRNISLTSGFQFWEPKVPFFEDKIDEVVRNFKLGDKETEVTILATKNSLMKLLSALDLKGHPETPALTRDEDNKLVVYTGRNKNVNKPADLLDVIKGESSNASPDDLAEAIVEADQEEVKDEIVIEREPLEAIVVLFDTSSSMNMSFLDTEISRINIVKEFFSAFAERTMAYDFHHVISLILFNHVVTQKCNFTEIFNSFIKHVKRTTATGLTHLYDALYTAANNLNTLSAKYPKILKRIICLSDGEDVGSTHEPHLVAKLLQNSNIVVDSFIVGPNCETLVGITHATGGHSFAPNSMDEGIRLFEWETVLRAGVRQKKEMKPQPVNYESDLDNFSKLGYHEKPSQIEQPAKMGAEVTKPSKVLRVATQNAPDIAKLSKEAIMRVKRVLIETHNLNTDPHPAFSFFPCEDEISFWRILMRGPEETPYQGGVFELYMQFPREYPQKPPEMRFVTPIYHCNINANGRICHSIFDRNYTVDTTVRKIFDCVYGLLMTPDPEDPLDNAIAQEYYTDLQMYRTKARQITLKEANKSFMEMQSALLKNKEEPDTGNHPDHFLDPITNELMEDPVLVKTSGKIYDRGTITAHIQKQGKDPFTQQEAGLGDLVPVDALYKAIEDYKKTNSIKAAWYLQ